MRLFHQSWIVSAVRIALLAALVGELIEAQWSVGFVALATLTLSTVPELVGRRLGVHLPVSMIAVISLFLFATLFLGEVLDFYNRYWWWDVALHGGSALGFGLMGVVFALFLFEGDRYAAPPWALSLIAFSFAVTIGAVWEIFEFAMDQMFGLNMQKSGLIDTMWDLIVDVIGAGTGAIIGFFYFIGRDLGGPTAFFREFARLNRKLFSRFR